jgi:hypothetical protein
MGSGPSDLTPGLTPTPESSRKIRDSFVTLIPTAFIGKTPYIAFVTTANPIAQANEASHPASTSDG